MYQKSEQNRYFAQQGSQLNEITACKKEALQEILQSFTKLSYVVFTRDFNMIFVLNKLVNVSK